MQEVWMSAALDLARQAGEANEVPVGAVVVLDDEIVGRGFNQPISRQDPTAHAEIEALRDAARNLGNYRLPGATLVVTIEPCTMCAGALIHARVGHLIFGAREPRAGAVCSTAAVLDNQQLNHRLEVTEGVLADDCSRLMTEFFQSRRR
jgi:tRNA(adenine34) deaminase